MKLQNIIIAVIVFIVSTGCDTDYPKLCESLEIENNCDKTIEISLGSLTKSDSSTIHKVYPYDVDCLIVDSYEYDLWLSEAQFLNLISDLKIYTVDAGDTVYIKPSHYNKINLWENEYVQDYWIEGYPSVNKHLLKVTNEMFNH